MPNWQGVIGVNRAYVIELYDRYLKDPNAVDADARTLFATWTPPSDGDAPEALSSASPDALQKAIGAVELTHSIRRYGHLAAKLDPLGTPPIGDPALDAATHGLTDDDLRALPPTLLSSPLAAGAANMLEVVERFRAVYCSTSGHDYAHVFVPEERRWLRTAVEQGRFRAPSDPINPVALLDRLTQVEAFERFLHRVFQAKTRFSIEAGAGSMFIGMAHRGRLNIMAHVLNKPYAQILAEFKDPVSPHGFQEDMSWTGDVKYHAGAHRAIESGREIRMVVAMPPNPSHLEAVDPVVVGMARAAGTSADHAGAPSTPRCPCRC